MFTSEESRRNERDAIFTALRILVENKPGAALNAVREDEPRLSAIVAKLRQPEPPSFAMAAFVKEMATIGVTVAQCESGKWKYTNTLDQPDPLAEAVVKAVVFIFAKHGGTMALSATDPRTIELKSAVARYEQAKKEEKS